MVTCTEMQERHVEHVKVFRYEMIERKTCYILYTEQNQIEHLLTSTFFLLLLDAELLDVSYK
jgi:hypothetical protein